MKIAFSAKGKDMSSIIDARFGRASGFLIYDTESREFSVVDNIFINSGQGAGIKSAETIIKAGVEVLITGDCGPKALSALRMANVRAYSVKEVSIAEALKAFEDGKLLEIKPE